MTRPTSTSAEHYLIVHDKQARRMTTSRSSKIPALIPCSWKSLISSLVIVAVTTARKSEFLSHLELDFISLLVVFYHLLGMRNYAKHVGAGIMSRDCKTPAKIEPLRLLLPPSSSGIRRMFT